MDLFLEFMKKSFQQRFAYRMNSYILILSTFVSLFILVSVWQALYQNKTSVNGITYENMLNFIIINMLVQSLIRSRIGQKIGERVEDGSISIDLVRPISFKGYFLADQLGENLFNFVFTTLPAALLAVLIWGFHPQGDMLQLVLFTLSLLNGIILMNQINYLFGLLAIWLKTAWFIHAITGAVISLFAGAFVPMWFYPALLYKICLLLPFHLVTFQPIAIFLGKTTHSGALFIIAAQLLWLAILLLIERWMWFKAQAKIDIHGG